MIRSGCPNPSRRSRIRAKKPADELTSSFRRDLFQHFDKCIDHGVTDLHPLVAGVLHRRAPAQAAGTAIPQWAGSSRAVVLFDLTSITVNPTGTIRTLRQRAIRIVSPAARDLATVGIVLNGRTSLQSFRAWSVAGGQTRTLTAGLATPVVMGAE